MVLKFWLYLLSLWLLFIFIFFITLNIPICVDNCDSIGFKRFFLNNIIPSICFILLIMGYIGYIYFKFQIQGSHEIPFTISEVESINYEHLTFLATYIIPLIGTDFTKPKAPYIFFFLIFIIGVIYIRTDLFYANPSLALLGFKIYKINNFPSKHRNSVILITKSNLLKDMKVSYIKLDDRIYYAEEKK